MKVMGWNPGLLLFKSFLFPQRSYCHNKYTVVLGRIWKLSDVDQDGMLDSDEFALAMHLINIKMEGHDLPSTLPEHLIPPSKR